MIGRIINSASQSESQAPVCIDKLCICGATDFIVVMQMVRRCVCAVCLYQYDNAGSVSLMKGILMRCGTQRRLLSCGQCFDASSRRARLCIFLREWPCCTTARASATRWERQQHQVNDSPFDNGDTLKLIVGLSCACDRVLFFLQAPIGRRPP